MNYKKLFLFSGMFFLYTENISAQNRQYTMEEATNGLSTTLAPESVKQASWQPGTHNFCRVVKTGDDNVWIRTHYPSLETDTLMTLAKLQYVAKNQKVLKTLPSFSWLMKNKFWFENNGDLVLVTEENGRIMSTSLWYSLPEGYDNLHVDKSGKIAYTLQNNIYLLSGENRAVKITNDEDKNLINGASEGVHRNEFGIDNGIFFSPKGNLIAYYHLDQRQVNDYPVIDWSNVPAKNNNIKYPMAGGASQIVTLRVYNPETGTTTELQTGEGKDHYLTSVTWSPDEKYIYVAILNRGQDHLWLNQYDALTGEKIKTLFDETSKTYVEPLHPLTFLPNSTTEFIWLSEADGYPHLYLYNTAGHFIRQLTKGSYEVNEIIGFNENTHEVILTSAKESPLEKHIYTVNYTNGLMRRIDKEEGMHTATASEDGEYLYDVYTSAHVPKVSMIRSTDGEAKKLLIKADDPLKDFDRPQIKEVTLKAADGTPLYGKLILPTHFDAKKKYPVIVYLYNGPHVQLIKNTFPESGNLWYEYLAQHGYVVFSMDGRGSENRGRKFEQATFRKLGTVEMEDQLKGVAYLKSLPYVDAERMGVHGWSFGGFMTTSLMLRHPGVFKVGVAGGPVMDWKMYEVMYTERYMDTPQENPEGYEGANLLTKVKNLKGKLLLIHGTNDATVVWQHSINFLKKAVDENIQVDYFVYPGYEHNVRGKDRVHLMQKITDYFDLYLKPEGAKK